MLMFLNMQPWSIGLGKLPAWDFRSRQLIMPRKVDCSLSMAALSVVVETERIVVVQVIDNLAGRLHMVCFMLVLVLGFYGRIPTRSPIIVSIVYTYCFHKSSKVYYCCKKFLFYVMFRYRMALQRTTVHCWPHRFAEFMVKLVLLMCGKGRKVIPIPQLIPKMNRRRFLTSYIIHWTLKFLFSVLFYFLLLCGPLLQIFLLNASSALACSKGFVKSSSLGSLVWVIWLSGGILRSVQFHNSTHRFSNWIRCHQNSPIVSLYFCAYYNKPLLT